MSFLEAPRHFVQVDNCKIQLELDGPNEQSKQVALRELRETPENVAKGLAELKALLAAEEGLQVPTDDASLMVVLRPCKFYAKSAFDLVVNVYKIQLKYSELFTDLIPSKASNALTNDVVTAFCNRDQWGRRTIIFKMGGPWDLKKVSVKDINRAITLLIYAFSNEPDTQINGINILYDLQGMTFSHATAVSPSDAKMIATIMGKGIPMRIKAIHHVNNSRIFEMAHKILKPFLSEKLRTRVYMHGTDMASLHKHIAPECLPPQYGGTSKVSSVNGVQWEKLFNMYENEFRLYNSWGYTKPPKK